MTSLFLNEHSLVRFLTESVNGDDFFPKNLKREEREREFPFQQFSNGDVVFFLSF